MYLVDVRLGVPGLGIITERYDFDDPVSSETFDKNIEMGCMCLSIQTVEPPVVRWYVKLWLWVKKLFIG